MCVHTTAGCRAHKPAADRRGATTHSVACRAYTTAADCCTTNCCTTNWCTTD